MEKDYPPRRTSSERTERSATPRSTSRSTSSRTESTRSSSRTTSRGDSTRSSYRGESSRAPSDRTSSFERSTPSERPVPRQAVSRGYGSRRKKKPPILPIAILLVVVVVIIIVCVNLFGKKDPAKTPGTSSLPTTSQTSGTGSQVVSGAQANTASVASTATPAPSNEPAKAPEGKREQLAALYLIGNTGYEYYNFTESTANEYITMVSKAGEELAGTATLYNVIVPTSMDIMLPEADRKDVNTNNQQEAIRYISTSINAMNPSVKTLALFDVLKQHNGEYIYFRTDHHWTQLGAYYAYREYCTAKGLTPLELDQFDKKSYPGFLGSFYDDSQSSDMKANPDTVEAFVPKVNASLISVGGDDLVDWPVIADGDEYADSMKYLIFIGGDQPYEEITNKDLNDGSSCMVVKESFGNAFVPFLVPHYQTVYVVDYRYYEGNIADLAKEKGIKDVIMMNNISMTRNSDLVADLSSRF